MRGAIPLLIEMGSLLAKVIVKALLIAEKPSVAANIEAVYKKMAVQPYEIDFDAAAGHIIELKDPSEYDPAWGNRYDRDILPVMPRKMQYKVKDGMEKRYKRLRDELVDGKYDYIINACDAGREGELIFSTIYDYAGCKTPVLRLWAQDNSDTGISRALTSMFDANEKKNLKNAAYLRQWQDNLEGINYSRAVTICAGSVFNIGRVMTAVTAMVVKRCREHDNFKPEPFYKGILTVAHKNGVLQMEIFVDEDGKKKTRFSTEDELKDLLIAGSEEGFVESKTEKKMSEYAPSLYNLTRLQMDANKMFGFDPSTTLDIAQKLYEMKLLSYPRSEAMHLSHGLAAEIESHIRSVMGVPGLEQDAAQILTDKRRIDRTIHDKRYVDDSKLTDHYALIPTDVTPDFARLTAAEQKVYTLVARRFLAIFFPPFVYEKLEVVCKFSGLRAFATGSAVINQGWRTLYKEAEGKYIPSMKEGDAVTVRDVDMEEGRTTPPKYYTDATLLEAMLNIGRQMEDDNYKNIMKQTKGIGTVATRAGIIKKLIDRDGYLSQKQKGKSDILATDKAYALMDILAGHAITQPELTAKRELELLDVEEGRMDANTYYKEMRQTISEETACLLATVKPSKGFDNERSRSKQQVLARSICPLCGGSVLVSEKYYRCESYKKPPKNCTFIISRNVNGVLLDDNTAIELLSGDSVCVKRKAKNGRLHGTTIRLRDGRIEFPDLAAYKHSQQTEGR